MAPLEIRGLPAGGPGVAQALVGVWCRSAPQDPITVERFRDLVLLDANFQPDGLRLAYEGVSSSAAVRAQLRRGAPRLMSGDGRLLARGRPTRERLVGAAYAVVRLVPMAGTDLEPARGWIPFFFVDPDARGRGIGRALLGSALDWLRARGRTEADFASYTPGYVVPGLDAVAYPEAAGLLASLGFRTLYQAAAMDRSLAGYAMPDAVLKRMTGLVERGFRFGPPTVDELVPLVALAAERFSADWARAIRDAVRSGLPLDHLVLARDPAGAVVGWAMWGAYEHRLERFGPFGVRDDQRGLGLGEVLLHLSLQRMRALGAHSAWFLWTGEESAAGALYRKAGFTVTRRFDVLRAEL